MHQLSEIHWIRRFYRTHLARYCWAVWLKYVYLNLRLFFIQSKNFIAWQVIRFRNAMIWHGKNFAHRRLEQSSFRLTQTRHSIVWHGKNFAHRRLEQSRFRLTQTRHSIVWHGKNFIFWLGESVANSLALMCLRLLDKNIAVYSMNAFSQYIEASNTTQREFIPLRELLLPMPNVYPERFGEFFPDNPWPLHVPSICALEVANAKVMGKSDLVFVEDKCLHHDLYRFEQDFLFEEMHDVVSIDATNQKLIRLKGRQVGAISSGISLVGSATTNYVHWLTETLPKLALIDGIDDYRNLPYIIDAGLHPNILESVHHLNLSGRKLIQIGRGEMLAVSRLIAISPVAYVPFDFKPGIGPDKFVINPDSALYSPDALQRVRELLVNRLGTVNSAPKRKLFLRRTGKSRPMNNATEIESLVEDHGFEIVEPEKLSFAEQVGLFSSAELIISQGGAALGNIIFAPPGCHVIVLTTWSPYTIHYYFANLAALLRQRCTLIMCEPVQSELGPHRAHMGVNVPIPILEKAIQQ